MVVAFLATACGQASVTTALPSSSAPATSASSTTGPSTSVSRAVAPTSVRSSTTEPQPQSVRTGAQRLVEEDFSQLDGLRVGVIVNQTSVVGGSHLIDLLDNAPNVELGAVFAPEHGVRGTADAGELVDDSVDAKTGVTIFSLYGATRQPTAAMFAGLDIIVYDLQDVGARHYTYISTMGLAMQTAAQAKIPFVVLDRPNPLGGDLLEGPVLEPDQLSFIGQYPIPSVYGMTAGELALAIKGEGWLQGLETLDLRVVEMQGWTRQMQWPQTGLDWVAPSPGLPTFASALAYPGTVFIEATGLSYGAGTDAPFRQVGATWLEGSEPQLHTPGSEGLVTEAVTFVPKVIADIAPNPRLVGQELGGVRYVSMTTGFRPFAAGLRLLAALVVLAERAGEGPLVERAATFDLLTGSAQIRTDLAAGVDPDQILATLQEGLITFDQLRQPYLLYEG